MAEDVKSINKMTLSVPTESGDFTVALWVVGVDNPDQEVYIEDQQNTGAIAAEGVLDTALLSNGFNAL